MKRRTMKISSVQNINPPLGESRLTFSPCSAAKATLGRSIRAEAREAVVRIEMTGDERGASPTGGGPPGWRTRRCQQLELALDLETDDDAEERGAFDERRENDRGRLDPAGHLRLTRHRVGHLTTDAADADAGADRGEARGETGADQREAGVVSGLSGRLQQGEQG